MSTEGTKPEDIQIDAVDAGHGQHTVTAILGERTLHRDTLKLNADQRRKQFVNGVLKTLPNLNGDAEAFRTHLAEQLLRLSIVPPGPANAAQQAGDLPEIDVRRVVRPELFHTATVSGLTVPIINDAGGKLLARWRTYLRWASGKREIVDTPERVILTDGTALYVSPDPGTPDASNPPAWSAASRRRWASGETSPQPTAVFRTLCERISYFIDFAGESAPGTVATLACWTILTYAYPAWDAVPYLNIGGPLGSGKTRVIDVLGRVAFRPLTTSNVTAPTLFRTLHASGGTLLCDEAERLKQSTPDQQELQSVLLAGYRRGGTATRLEPLPEGGFRPVRFEVYGPKVLACIANLPPALNSRCIPITMFRSASDSPKPSRRLDSDEPTWQSIRDDLHVIALEYGPEWMNAANRSDVVPPGVSGRAYELWQPILAVAAWLDGLGATGLLEILKKHALATLAAMKDDAVPEADEILLEVLTKKIQNGEKPTTKELLDEAANCDPTTFKMWHPKTVSARLSSYGIKTPKKLNGKREYRDVTTARLKEIQDRYGVDLGLA
jgi:hypothetical protein